MENNIRMKVNIGGFEIAKNNPCFVIAEGGVNHNGDINLAIELIEAAAKTGADCVKFQTFQTEKIITKNAPKAEYQLKQTSQQESQFQMLKKLELKQTDYPVLLKECQKRNIIFLSTPYSKEDADFLDSIGVFAFKIASGQLTEHSFLEYVAKKGKPMIVSTGMGTMAEVAEAVDVMLATGNDQIILLQCTTNYPSNIEDSNVKAMNTMGNSFNLLAGYSDHVPNDYACFAAVALGATVIEKHMTLDKTMEGPDHSSSLDPEEFKKLVDGIRQIELSLGTGVKVPCAIELSNQKNMRRSIVAVNDISKGEVLTEDHFIFKRPYTGILPKELPKLIGKKAMVDIEKDTILDYSMIDWK